MRESAKLGHPVNGAGANVDLGDATQRWREHAQCRGLGFNLFFPEVEDGPDAQDARRICSVCPVVSAAWNMR